MSLYAHFQLNDDHIIKVFMLMSVTTSDPDCTMLLLPVYSRYNLKQKFVYVCVVVAVGRSSNELSVIGAKRNRKKGVMG